MAVLFNITHDANNLNEYDTTVTDGGDLSTGTPGLAGTTAKMEAFIDDANGIYGEKDISGGPASGIIRIRFYLDPNGTTIDGVVVPCKGRCAGSPTYSFAHILLQKDNGTYSLLLQSIRDDGNPNSIGSWSSISDAEHYVEFQIERATDAESNDGVASWWIDGVLIASESNDDNYDVFADIDGVRLGATDTGTSTSGTLYLDELKANDDGSEIGPVGADALPMAMHHYRMRRI